LILPEAVTLNRFLAEDLVFILGILLIPFKALRSRHGMPFTGQAAFNGGVKAKIGRQIKHGG
jgi:hypothetical protein